MTEKAIARGEKIRHHNENCFHIKVKEKKSFIEKINF